MSIIEEAVRKTAERYQRPAPPEQSGGRPRLRRVPSQAIDPSKVRRFQPVTLDRAVLEENHILPQITDPGALRAYKILRTRMLRRLEANQWHSFAVTGATAGEGKTLTSINLAMALAQDSNTWVFLVDLDLQRPKVADYLGLDNSLGERGLTDFCSAMRRSSRSPIHRPRRSPGRHSEFPSPSPMRPIADLAADGRAGAIAGGGNARVES